ncbi:CotY/CotZ family spore coat protein [Bacillus sp. DTU_2020_1000418_1_SI_GHA_SEK_038]|uniref:CotY/CotZ family spore coat protein n=1 Tax=Bacillus sp. DTU_2020_1000418_1_SI_GHA_SEK_038 TaxID=3077585 RepID=UPI0028ED2DAD|nr:CotY/CotZ family spore coat protein [Bacillus sp. DTU_2020_1000418_1_SI_GHA_SEK_038]WNS75842.1 CotY/CotZ family spore coat protein [Bacillus sp. DTU_2020_1000418_1_SI_GHA_SEK_038]
MGNHDLEHKHCLCEALIELKNLQDILTNSSTKHFGALLSKIAGTDTIPFLLIKKDGPLSHRIMDTNEITGKHECFESTFFRLESIDKDTCCARISILRPMNIKGELTNSFCDVMKLAKTSKCIEIDISCICAIQVLDTELLKRKIVVEPKW